MSTANALLSNDDVQNLKIFVGTITDGMKSNEEWLHFLGRFYVFVQIPFRQKFKNIYELGIKTAVESLGMRCEKVDEIKLPHDILQKIYECIRKADIIISEMTDKSPNVFYETGYAHALGKPTILLSQRKKDSPFDVEHFKQIIYKKNDLMSLQAQLKDMLLATRREIMVNKGSPKKTNRDKQTAKATFIKRPGRT